MIEIKKPIERTREDGKLVYWRLIRTKASCIDFLETLDLDNLVLDTESLSLDYYSTMLGISLYSGGKEAVFIALDTKYWESEITLEILKTLVDPILKKAKIIGHNLKYDSGVFKQHGLFYEWDILDDTSLLIHTVNPDLRKGLEMRVDADFNYPKPKFDELVTERLQLKKKAKWENMPWSEEVLEILAEYASEDAYWTYRLWKHYKPLTMDIDEAYKKIEIPLTKTLRDMETRGICVDVPFLLEMGERLDKDMVEYEQSIYEECGYEFNLNSPKQLAEILFDKLGLPVLKRTKSGAPSTDKGSLEELALYGHDVAQRLVEYSQMDTLRGSFVKKIPLLVNSKDNRLHCSFNADVTRTGRLSSSDPNLQNQPNNKKYPVRKAYIPAKGYKFIILDYSQIEPRIMAHQSRDPKMCAVFNAGSDIYTGIATELGVTRDVAKVIQLAMSYGMGADKLAAMLRQPLHYAERKISEYKATYKVFFHWKKDIEASVRMNGYVETMFGRRRVLPDIKSTNKGVYFSVLRKATNTPIQGSAADIIKIVMNRMHKRFKKEKWDAHLLLSVHDELLIEVHEDIAEKIIPSIIDIVENTVTLDVPLKCELKLCDNWSQMKDKSYPEWGTAAPTIYLPTYEDLIIYGVA